MNEQVLAIIELLQKDQRYHLEAYQFVREGLGYAQKVMKLPATKDDSGEAGGKDHHLTGQQLCVALKEYALDRYGYLAQTVLNSWGIYTTSDFGEIVYNLIRIKEMRKSKTDRREDFDDQFEFEEAFQPRFELSSDAS
ncbi:Minf_1886 family protein [Pirellulaceae bacterium SH449]